MKYHIHFDSKIPLVGLKRKVFLFYDTKTESISTLRENERRGWKWRGTNTRPATTWEDGTSSQSPECDSF